MIILYINDKWTNRAVFSPAECARAHPPTINTTTLTIILIIHLLLLLVPLHYGFILRRLLLLLLKHSISRRVVQVEPADVADAVADHTRHLRLRLRLRLRLSAAGVLAREADDCDVPRLVVRKLREETPRACGAQHVPAPRDSISIHLSEIDPEIDPNTALQGQIEGFR